MGISGAPHAVQRNENASVSGAGLSLADDPVAAAIANETIRQRESIELIASENLVSRARAPARRPLSAALLMGSGRR